MQLPYSYIILNFCSWKLQYLRSEFKGQLPQPFSNHENATSIIQAHFNNMNKEEPSRYVSTCFI